MKIHPSILIQLALTCLVLFLSSSCNKDSDLLSEYVIENPKALLVNDIVVTLANNSIVIEPLKNDSFEEPDKVIVSGVTPPKMGTATVNEDNTITYTPNTDEIGTDQFDYSTTVTNTDNSVSEETGSVTVTVTDKTSSGSPTDMGPLKAFPSAYGAASGVTGGRGGSVYRVTNLDNSGAGSFRDAVSQSNRTIVFDVSGTIDLTSSLNIRSNNLTIAGQTAPEGGISITGSNVYFQNVNNVILRYVRFRPDYNSSGNVDAVNITSCSNMIIDHCSVTWGGDEAMSVIGSSTNFTIQRTIFAESATGCLYGDSNENISDNLSLHTSLFYNISHRFPNTNADHIEVLNTVVHNWNTRLMVVSPSKSNPQLNEINNYRQRGARPTSVLTSGRHEGNWLDIGSSSQRSGTRVYTSGNVINGVLGANDDQWSQYLHRFNITSGQYAGIKQWDAAHKDFKAASPFPMLGAPLPVQTAQEAFDDVTTDVGACRTLNADGTSVKAWDVLDNRYLGYVRSNTYDPYTYPPVAIVSKSHYITYRASISSKPINTRPAGYDTDKDGMPDTWEKANNLDLNDPKDAISDKNGDGYTNLEDFLNQVDF